MNDICKNCGEEIKISIFKGTGHCGENCRKALEEKKERLLNAIEKPVLCSYPTGCQDIAQECGLCIPHCEYTKRVEDEMKEKVDE